MGGWLAGLSFDIQLTSAEAELGKIDIAVSFWVLLLNTQDRNNQDKKIKHSLKMFNTADSVEH